MGSGGLGWDCILSLGSPLGLVLGVVVVGEEVLELIWARRRHREVGLRMDLRAAGATRMGLGVHSLRSLPPGVGMAVVRKVLSMGYSHRCNVHVALRPPRQH